MRETPLVPLALLSRVVDCVHPRRIVLFGSRARGEAGPDSDIDLLVILDDDAPAEYLTLRAGWESRRGYDRPVDVIPVRDAVHRRRAKSVGTMAYEAEIDRIAVYGPPRSLAGVSGNTFQVSQDVDISLSTGLSGSTRKDKSHRFKRAASHL